MALNLEWLPLLSKSGITGVGHLNSELCLPLFHHDWPFEQYFSVQFNGICPVSNTVHLLPRWFHHPKWDLCTLDNNTWFLFRQPRCTSLMCFMSLNLPILLGQKAPHWDHHSHAVGKSVFISRSLHAGVNHLQKWRLQRGQGFYGKLEEF